MSEIKELIQKVIEFRDARDWEQFHNSKDLAIALNLEASELLELFLWKDNEGADVEKLKHELADVITYALMLAHKHNLDVKTIVEEKLEISGKKYPVEKAKGTAKKYNEL
jgi:NTP pyrophosphatase (non-canonical NTP hydrolase)